MDERGLPPTQVLSIAERLSGLTRSEREIYNQAARERNKDVHRTLTMNITPLANDITEINKLLSTRTFTDDLLSDQVPEYRENLQRFAETRKQQIQYMMNKAGLTNRGQQLTFDRWKGINPALNQHVQNSFARGERTQEFKYLQENNLFVDRIATLPRVEHISYAGYEDIPRENPFFRTIGHRNQAASEIQRRQSRVAGIVSGGGGGGDGGGADGGGGGGAAFDDLPPPPVPPGIPLPVDNPVLLLDPVLGATGEDLPVARQVTDGSITRVDRNYNPVVGVDQSHPIDLLDASVAYETAKARQRHSLGEASVIKRKFVNAGAKLKGAVRLGIAMNPILGRGVVGDKQYDRVVKGSHIIRTLRQPTFAFESFTAHPTNRERRQIAFLHKNRNYKRQADRLEIEENRWANNYITSLRKERARRERREQQSSEDDWAFGL